MKLKKLQTYAIVSILILVVFAGIPTSVSAKKDGESTSALEPETGLSIEVRSEGKGYLIVVEGSEDQKVFLIVIDKNGDKSVYEFDFKPAEFKPAEFRLWVSEDIVENRNDLYVVRIHARNELIPDDTGLIPALTIDVVKIKIEGKNKNVKISLTPRIKIQLSFDLDLTTGLPPGGDALDVPLTFSGIKRDTKVLGSSVDSFFDSEYEIKLQSSQPGHHINSFFDVVYEINFDSPPPGHGEDFNSFFDVSYDLRSEDFIINSFFEISYKNSNKGTEFIVNSFFDIDYEFDLPYPGSLDDIFSLESFFDVFSQFEFLSTAEHSDFNSFFDIYTEINLGLPQPIQGDPTRSADTFFEVVLDLDVGFPSPDAEQRNRFVDNFGGLVIESKPGPEDDPSVPGEPSSVEISSELLHNIHPEEGVSSEQILFVKSSTGSDSNNEMKLKHSVEGPEDVVFPNLPVPDKFIAMPVKAESSAEVKFDFPVPFIEPLPSQDEESTFDVKIEIKLEGEPEIKFDPFSL
jgi:hypothetical protein